MRNPCFLSPPTQYAPRYAVSPATRVAGSILGNQRQPETHPHLGAARLTNAGLTRQISLATLGRMNIRDYRDRVWYNFQNAERASRYYSRLSDKLQTRHKIVTFILAVAPVAAIAMLQSDWDIKQVLVAFILYLVAIIELALIHFDLGGNVKAARIMNVESDRVANQWRKLW